MMDIYKGEVLHPMSIDIRISTVLVIMFIGFGMVLWRHHFLATTSTPSKEPGPIGFALGRPT